MTITADRLRHALHYDPETGVFTRRVDAHNGRWKAGEVAGSYMGTYLAVWIDGKNHLAHRLAWLYMTGARPPEAIDHRDMDHKNNRWRNLRAATKSTNGANRKKPSSNRSGFKGVSLCGSTGMWRADISKDGIKKNLGRFPTKEAAHAAYATAAGELFGEFARAE